MVQPPAAGGADGDAYALKVRWNLVSVPSVLVIAVTFLFPLAIVLVYSFLKDGRNGRILHTPTFGNYVAILTDPFYLGVLGQTLLMGLLVAALCVLLGYPVAYFLARTQTRWRGMLIFLAVSPLMVSSVIRNVGWLPILGDAGAVNTLLLKLGVIGSPVHILYTLPGVVIGLTNALLPYTILLLMIVVQRVNYEVEEAAINLGASRSHLFWLVLLPLTKRGMIAAFLLVFTIAISSYTTPAVLGGGKVLVMPTFIQQQISVVLKNAFGSALTVVLLAVVIAITTMSTRTVQDRGRP
jgi:putative spermidine/putrescine transport system permease protein